MAFLCVFSSLIPHIQAPPIVPISPKSFSRSPGTCIKPGQVRTPLTLCAIHHQALHFIDAEVCQHVSEDTMSGKNFQGLKEQAEGAAKDAGKKD